MLLTSFDTYCIPYQTAGFFPKGIYFYFDIPRNPITVSYSSVNVFLLPCLPTSFAPVLSSLLDWCCFSKCGSQVLANRNLLPSTVIPLRSLFFLSYTDSSFGSLRALPSLQHSYVSTSSTPYYPVPCSNSSPKALPFPFWSLYLGLDPTEIPFLSCISLALTSVLSGLSPSESLPTAFTCSAWHYNKN